MAIGGFVFSSFYGWDGGIGSVPEVLYRSMALQRRQDMQKTQGSLILLMFVVRATCGF